MRMQSNAVSQLDAEEAICDLFAILQQEIQKNLKYWRLLAFCYYLKMRKIPYVSSSQIPHHTTTHLKKVISIPKKNGFGRNQRCRLTFQAIIEKLAIIENQLKPQKPLKLKLWFDQTFFQTRIVIILKDRQDKDNLSDSSPFFRKWRKQTRNSTKLLYYDLILELGSWIGIEMTEMKSILEKCAYDKIDWTSPEFNIKNQIPKLFEKLNELLIPQWSQVFQLLLVGGPTNFSNLHQQLQRLEYRPKIMDQRVALVKDIPRNFLKQQHQSPTRHSKFGMLIGCSHTLNLKILSYLLKVFEADPMKPNIIKAFLPEIAEIIQREKINLEGDNVYQVLGSKYLESKQVVRKFMHSLQKHNQVKNFLKIIKANALNEENLRQELLYNGRVAIGHVKTLFRGMKWSQDYTTITKGRYRQCLEKMEKLFMQIEEREKRLIES